MGAPRKDSSKIANRSAFKEIKSMPPIEHELIAFIQEMNTAIYICDNRGRITFFNEAATRLWGRKPKIGKDLWCGAKEIFQKDGNPVLPDACPMAITIKQARAIQGEELIIARPDGSNINVVSNSKPIIDNAGNLKGAINIILNITEKRQKKQALIESEDKFRILSKFLKNKIKERTINFQKSEDRYFKMIEEIQDYAILLLDIKGNILNWNKGAAKIKGYSEKEIIGKNFRIFYQEKDRMAGLPEQLIKEAIEHDKAMHEGWRLRKNGDRFWGSIVITALHDEKKNIIGFSKVTRDLTEKKLAEDKIDKYARELEFQNQELEQFAFIASHDLQEPLRKIQTFSSMLERDIDNKTEVKYYLNKINNSAKRMEDLIKDILKYSLLSLNDDLFIPTDLNQLIGNLKEDFELLFEQRQVKFNYSKLPVIKAIPIQLQQLFSNLIDNAIKFSVNNPVIEISAKKLANKDIKNYPNLTMDKEYYHIIFKDKGIGFDPQFANQIFKLFKRLNKEKSGYGIGLALCKKIIEIHKGDITVSSEPNKGTSFHIFLPTS